MLVGPQPIEPTEVLAGTIAVYKNIWPNVEDTIKTFEEIAAIEDDSLNERLLFKRATVISPSNTLEIRQARTNSNLDLSYAANYDAKLREINNRFFDLLTATLPWYRKQFNLGRLYEVESYNVLRYQTGEHYEAHFDGPTSTGRVVSPILYLNDDYEGGELEFVNFGIKIKPEPGMFLLFSASYPYSHIAHPVVSGTKYAIVTWLHDREN